MADENSNPNPDSQAEAIQSQTTNLVGETGPEVVAKEESVKTFTQEEVDRIIGDRLRREGVNEMRDKAKQFDELQEQRKSEDQRRAEALDKARREATEAAAERDRYRAAVKYGISEDLFDLLGSGDAEVISKRAESLSGLIAKASRVDELESELKSFRESTKGAPTRTPVANLRPGATPAEQQVPENDYPAHWKK